MLWLWHCRLGAGLKGGGALAWRGWWWKKRGGGGDNAERMPRSATAGPVFALSGATDEPQMDGQLLWVSEPGEVGVTRGVMCIF